MPGRRIPSLLLGAALIFSLTGMPMLAAAEQPLSIPATSNASTEAASGAVAKNMEAATSVCEIGSTPFASLDVAIATVPKDGTQITIKLLADITETKTCALLNQNILFNLNGHNLIFDCSHGDALDMTNSFIDYANPGTLQAISSNGNALNITGGTCRLTRAESLGISIDATDAAAVTVNGDVKALNIKSPEEGTGVLASDNTSITVNGAIVSTGDCVCAVFGSAVTVRGSLTSVGDVHIPGMWSAIMAGSGSTVVVSGDVSSTGDGLDVECAQVIVEGNVVAREFGVLSFAGYGDEAASSMVQISGNVTSLSLAGVSASDNSQVIVDGSVTSGFGNPYIYVDNEGLSEAMYLLPTTKAGYRTYENSQSPFESVIWIKDINAGDGSMETTTNPPFSNRTAITPLSKLPKTGDTSVALNSIGIVVLVLLALAFGMAKIAQKKAVYSEKSK